jgi:RNA-binding protein
MKLSEKQKKHLRQLGHALKPLVQTGNQGLTEAVLRQIEEAIEYHELIKVRLIAEDREQKQQFIDQVVDATGAHLVQKIGHVILIYRHNPERNRIQLPN